MRALLAVLLLSAPTLVTPAEVKWSEGPASLPKGTQIAVLDKANGTAFPAGSDYVTPPRQNHYLWFEEETVLQMTNQGPWELHLVPN
jgi:hypothetical protein